MWCKALTKKPKSIKQQISLIWRWGEDIFLKDLNGSTTFYYCWLCKKQKQVQKLITILKGRYTALDYLYNNYNINRSTSELKERRPSNLDQPTIKEYPV